MKSGETDVTKEVKDKGKNTDYKIFSCPDVKRKDFDIKDQKEFELSEEEIQEIRFLEKMDHEAIKKIEMKYGGYIDKEKLKEAKLNPTKFEKHKEYVEGIKKLYPEEGWDRILGDFREGTFPVIDKDRKDRRKTDFHERLHQIRREDFRKELGAGMDEGLTEYFAKECAGSIELKDIPECYPKEKRVIEMLMARVGERPFALAYFRGYVPVLEEAVDRELGKGSLREIASCIRSENFERAEEIVKKGRKISWKDFNW